MSSRWHRYFLDMSLLSARMSKDPDTQVGAVAVTPDRQVIATGFNGFPRGIKDTDERLRDKDWKLANVIHAERNVICAAGRRGGLGLLGSTLYLAATDDSGLVWGGPPCTGCSNHLIQAGVSRIITYPFKAGPSRWKEDVEQARFLLLEAGIDLVEIPYDRLVRD